MPKKAVDLVKNDDGSGHARVAFTMEAKEGETAEVLVFDLSKVNADVLTRLALHGASQKIGDSYAGAKESGEDPVAYARAAVVDTIQQLYDGKWSVTRSGTGAPRTSLLVQAYSLVSGKTIEEAQEIIGQLSDEERKEVQGKKKIAAKIAAIRAEQAVARATKLAEEAAKEDAAAPVA